MYPVVLFSNCCIEGCQKLASFEQWALAYVRPRGDTLQYACCGRDYPYVTCALRTPREESSQLKPTVGNLATSLWTQLGFGWGNRTHFIEHYEPIFKLAFISIIFQSLVSNDVVCEVESGILLAAPAPMYTTIPYAAHLDYHSGGLSLPCRRNRVDYHHHLWTRKLRAGHQRLKVPGMRDWGRQGGGVYTNIMSPFCLMPKAGL